MAIGLKELLNDRNFNTTDATIGIFTDSHGLCDHLMKLKREDTPVEIHTLCLVRQLNRLLELQPKQITIHWIPSHKGIGDNELADEQAEKGHKSKDIVTIPYTRKWLKTKLLGQTTTHFHEYLQANVRSSQLVPTYPDREHFKIPRNKKSSTRV